jgi:hypothetical protein
MRARGAARGWATGRRGWTHRLQVPVDAATWKRVVGIARREQVSIAVVARRLVRDGLEAAQRRAA